MDYWECPICKVQRPVEPHLDWCTSEVEEELDEDA